MTRGNGTEVLSLFLLSPTASVFGDEIVFQSVNWKPDQLEAGRMGEFFGIRRYYMADWHGIFTTINSGQAYLAVINCLGADISIQIFREEFIKNPNIDFQKLPAISDLGLSD